MVRPTKPPTLPNHPSTDHPPHQSRDSSHHHLHLHAPRHADLFEDFNRTTLPQEDVNINPQHAPPNPEDEDDVVPDQHAAFGIQRATQARREPPWRDLGLDELVRAAPGDAAGLGGSAGMTAAGAAGTAGTAIGGGVSGSVGVATGMARGGASGGSAVGRRMGVLHR
jgi:hypothetical protein